METLIQSMLLKQEWHARVDPSIGDMVCSWDWLPSVVLSSWERNESMLALDALVKLLIHHRFQSPQDCVALIDFPFVSVERNDLGEWETTSVTRQLMFRYWHTVDSQHLMRTWIAWTQSAKRTFDEWHDVTCDILSSGANLFLHLDAQHVRILVDSFRPRAKQAARVFGFLCYRYERSLETLAKHVLYGEQMILTIMAHRPEWLWDEEERDKLVSLLVGQSMSSAITQIETVLGMQKQGVFWPDNVRDPYADEHTTITYGIMLVNDYFIEPSLYECLLVGARLVSETMGPFTMRSLLRAPIGVLRDWCGEHDPPNDLQRCLALYMQKNELRMMGMWSKFYRCQKRCAPIWARAVMKMNVSKQVQHDMLLLCMFDMAQWRRDGTDQVETNIVQKNIVSILREHAKRLDPKTLVAIAGGIAMMMDKSQLLYECMEVAARESGIRWRQAIESFPKEIDRVVAVLQRLEAERQQALRHKAFVPSYRPLAVVPLARQGLMNASFPWEMLTKVSSFEMPVDWPGTMYRHRTLDQAIQLLYTSLDLDVKIESMRGAGQAMTLYVPEYGLDRRWRTSRTRIHFRLGMEDASPSVVCKMDRAYVVCVCDESVRQIATNESNLAADVALAAATDRGARVFSLDDLDDQDVGIVWNAYSLSNKTVLAAEAVVEQIVGYTTYLKDVWHAMLACVWKSGLGEYVCTWESIGSFVASGQGFSPCGISDSTMSVAEREGGYMIGDSFCGPLVHQEAVQSDLLILPVMPLAWKAEFGHARHYVRPVFSLE